MISCLCLQYLSALTVVQRDWFGKVFVLFLSFSIAFNFILTRFNLVPISDAASKKQYGLKEEDVTAVISSIFFHIVFFYVFFKDFFKLFKSIERIK